MLYVNGPDAMILYTNHDNTSSVTKWFKSLPELEYEWDTDRLAGRVPVSELSNIEETVKQLPLVAPDTGSR